jgi:hypothetical protein
MTVKYLSILLATALLFGCKPPNQQSLKAQTESFASDSAALKKNAKQILNNIKVWSVRNAEFLQQAVAHAQRANPMNSMQSGSTLSLSERGPSTKLNNLHQYLICNSPLRGLYVYGQLDSPLAKTIIDRVPLIKKVPGLNSFANMQANGAFSAMAYSGIDLEEGLSNGLSLGKDTFSMKALNLELYVGAGVDYIIGDPKIYHELYVGSVPIPIPNTPIVLDGEFYYMTDYDESGITLNYGLPKIKAGNLDIEPSVGLMLAFSREKIAQVLDVDRWTGKKSTDCGEGPVQEMPTIAKRTNAAFNSAIFTTPAEQSACKAQLSRGSNYGNKRCHVASLVNNSKDILFCLKSQGGRACLTRENMCGPSSGGAFDCNIENAIDCLCSNGGMSCFKPGYQVNNGSTNDRHVCQKR